jgi:chromosomal replication initiator protein
LTSAERETVAALEQVLRRRIGEPRYRLWFEGRTRFTWNDGLLTIGVPNLHFQEWLHKTFSSALVGAAAEVLGQTVVLRFVIDPQLFQAARQEQAAVEAAPSPQEGKPEPPKKPDAQKPKRVTPGGKREPSPALFDSPATSTSPPSEENRKAHRRRWHRLSDFVVGPCNRVAHASAVSVVEDPGQGANPLVLYGPTGTGKTHLLEGIYVGLRQTHHDWRLCLVTAEDFTNRFVQAMRMQKLGSFRNHFRNCDALLVDDLHFLVRKKATQEEFLHTFDALVGDGRQVVVTCDCHPRLADEFSSAMTDRLLGGVLWGLMPPDAETRLAILRAESARIPPRVPEEVLALLATRLRGNVRELQGALHGLSHFSRVSGQPIDRHLAEEALADLLRHAVRVVQLGEVDAAVCGALHLESGSLQAKGRTWAVSHPRLLAMYLARKHTAASCNQIGEFFGGRNHSTVLAAEKKIRQLLQEDGKLVLGDKRLYVREVIERIERALLS